ncbi:MAG: polyphosphate polymerase domain-containing protein [Bacteroidia bacterium]
MRAECRRILKDFNPVSLDKLDSVRLLNRVDTKFVFNANILPSILKELISSYFVLEINRIRDFEYNTLYFDTPDLNYYQQHQRGKLNRTKVRHRTYVDSKTGYFEVKFKTNKGRTIKKRLLHNKVTFDDKQAQDFFKNVVNINPNNLIPQIWIKYNRITLVNPTLTERITIDLNLQFTKNNIFFSPYESLIIAEVKQDRKCSNSEFLNLMKKHRIKEGAISKYCLAIATTNEAVKKNNFKEKIQSLNKLVHVN